MAHENPEVVTYGTTCHYTALMSVSHFEAKTCTKIDSWPKRLRKEKLKISQNKQRQQLTHKTVNLCLFSTISLGPGKLGIRGD